MDLVSTTRGRLTFNGVIQLGFSDFNVNASGEVVYVAPDSNNNMQVYSTVRRQITSDAVDHYNPCINDLGEIIWNRYGAGPGLVSSTRGPLPGIYPLVFGLNNFDEFCYEGNLESGGLSTSPHLFSNLHGVVINDAYQYQWGGGINDAGTLVWSAPANPSTPVWSIFEATWLPSPVLSVIPTIGPGLLLRWPTNGAAFHVQFATNLSSSSFWQRLNGTTTTDAGYISLAASPATNTGTFFRLSTGPP